MSKLEEILAEIQAYHDSPEGKAAAEAERLALIAAKEAIQYPVLFNAMQVGRVLRVGQDGTVDMGYIDYHTDQYEYVTSGLQLFTKLQSEACPEIHNIYHGEVEVGYVRLRHGMVSVRYTYGGRMEYLWSDAAMGDGRYLVDEREVFLDKARGYLYERYLKDLGK